MVGIHSVFIEKIINCLQLQLGCFNLKHRKHKSIRLQSLMKMGHTTRSPEIEKRSRLVDPVVQECPQGPIFLLLLFGIKSIGFFSRLVPLVVSG